MDIIFPCGGRSSRFPGDIPKYLWPIHSTGLPMVAHAIKQWPRENGDYLHIAVLEKHYEEAHRIIEEALTTPEEKSLGEYYAATGTMASARSTNVNYTVLPEVTAGPADTCAAVIRKYHISGPILIRDPDAVFTPLMFQQPFPFNAVCTHLAFDGMRDPEAKCWVDFGGASHPAYITRLREKQGIGINFCCGGYYFESSDDFLTALDRLPLSRERFVSSVVSALIHEGKKFYGVPCSQYEDYGTFDAWAEETRKSWRSSD